MKVDYKLSHTVIATGQPSTVDLLITFKADQDTVENQRRPLNISVIIDRSGSMAGNSLKYAKQAAKSLVERLSEDDIISIVIYDDHAETILEPQKATDKKDIYTKIEGIRAGGCTDLHRGWQTGCDHVHKHLAADKVNRVLLLTDGQANSGIQDSPTLIKLAEDKAKEGIVTTTLGFGSGFNEDLLIGLANAASGNFYYIQTPDEAVDVFRIELESISSVIAQNLVVNVTAADTLKLMLLNNYRTEKSNNQLAIKLGDVYAVEEKLLALEIDLPAQANTGPANLFTLSYQFSTKTDNGLKTEHGEIPISLQVAGADEAARSMPNLAVIEQANHLRIARVKEEAIELSDKGEHKAASEKLRKVITDLKLKTVQESFELAEELDQLDHYAQQLERNQFNHVLRKEMRDQSYQARTRNRKDLKLRGLTSGSARELATVDSDAQGVILQCHKEGGKLRVKVVSPGFNPDFNVQFPRNIREEGVTYIAEAVTESADGTFYKVTGKIQRLVRPGEPDRYAVHSSKPRRTAPPKASSVNGTAADLETTDSVGTGVLVQCVPEGKKLRARVVSDGYNPDWNMRFPRSIREEGILYVVDEVIEPTGGGSYIACGKIKRLIQ